MTPRAEIFEAPRSADLECGKRNLKRYQEVPFKATGRETVAEDVHSAPESKVSETINTKPHAIFQIFNNTKTNIILPTTKSSVYGFVKKVLNSRGHKKLWCTHFFTSIVGF